VRARFPLAMDASHADGLEFWFFGDGSGREVRAQVLDGRDESRPWELVWSDEFDGPAGALPDPSVWTPEIGDGTANGIPGWGNAERQTYTNDPANLSLDGDGNLVIRALETHGDAPLCYYGAPCEYSSARIITAGNLEVTYGRIEARIKIPYGQGLWPAFWMLGNDIFTVGWPESGEIDIMENVGREPDRVHGTVHGPGYSGGSGIGGGVRHPDGGRFADDFHVYAIDWYPDRIVWSLDGVPYSTVTPARPAARRALGVRPPELPHPQRRRGRALARLPRRHDHLPAGDGDRLRARLPGAGHRRALRGHFRDDTAGWTRVRLPFSAFERAAAQPDGAPEGAFDGSELWGVAIEIGGGAGSAMIDEVRWYVEE
jgi:hypothetical protein